MADVNSITINRNLFTRLFSKIKISTEHFYKGVPCWEWTANVHQDNGYAYFGISSNKSFTAHRIFYRLFVQPIPKGLECDHLCRVRHCVNPIHLEAVTHKENMARAIYTKKKGSPFRAICSNGHEMSGSNIRIGPCKRRGVSEIRRYCRQCCKESDQRQREKRKQAKGGR